MLTTDPQYMRLSTIAVLFAILASGCTKQPSVEFGLLDDETVTATRDIQYEIGASYGYRVNFPTDIGKVILKQEFFLPGPARWTTNDPGDVGNIRELSEEISPDGSKLVSETEVDTSIETGAIQQYRIIEGDPAGPHTINLWLNGKPLKTIDFKINK